LIVLFFARYKRELVTTVITMFDSNFVQRIFGRYLDITISDKKFKKEVWLVSNMFLNKSIDAFTLELQFSIEKGGWQDRDRIQVSI